MTINRQKIIDTVKALVADKHVNVQPARYGEWISMLDRLTPGLLTASPGIFQSKINSSLTTLQTSHTAFLRPNSETIPLRHALCATTRRHQTAIGHRWVFQDVFEDGPADLAGIRPGRFLIACEGKSIFASESPLFALGRTYSLTIGDLNGTEPTTGVGEYTRLARKRQAADGRGQGPVVSL